jgi:hypothetical protein
MTGPPEKKAPGDGNLRGRTVNRKVCRIVRRRPPPIKNLIAHVQLVWLFAVIEGARVTYYVERLDLVWRFADPVRARAKFEREAKRHARQNGDCLKKGATHGTS